MNRSDGLADLPAPASLQYRRPVVRDLAWLVLDGALPLPPVSGDLQSVHLSQAEREELLDLLAAWDTRAQDDWLGPIEPRLRLGIYTERLIGAWLRHSRLIRLVAMNWPLRDGRTTVGEADFLVERLSLPRDRLQLWELACKFYLGVADVGWLGPGLLDSLDAKLSRIRSHQLPLIHRPGFRDAWGSAWTAHAWIAGWLLEPAPTLLKRSPQANPGAGLGTRIAGVWAESGTDSVAIVERQASALGVSEWWVLPKRRWLRPVFADDPVPQRLSRLDDGSAALPPAGTGEADHRMLAGIRWQSCADGLVASEALRVMLVPAGWARRARSGLPSDPTRRRHAPD